MMTAPTHISFAEFVYLLLLTTTGVSLNPLNAAAIAFSSLLPDVDTAASSIGRLVPVLSLRVERRFGHRTITHSALFIAGIAIVTLPLSALSPDLYTCIVVGYGSHSFLDTMTVNGVKLFYPFSPAKCVFPLEVNNPHRYRIRTGGKMDKALAAIFLIGCVPTFIIAYQGYERFIRVTQHNVEAAVRDYNEFSKDHLVFATVSAYSMITKEPLGGTVEVVGALNPHTLVFRGRDDRLHTLGKDFQADFVAKSVLCTRGARAWSTVREVDLSNCMVSQIASIVDTTAQIYLFGDLTPVGTVSLPENIRVFTPVTGAAGRIRFNFATMEDIRNFNLGDLFVAKGILTIKSIVRGSPPMNLDTAAGSPAGLNNYVQIAAVAEPRESLVILKQKGDTLMQGEVVLRKSLGHLFGAQITFLKDQILTVKNRSEAAILGIERRLADAVEALRIDSVDCAHTLELFRNGFVSRGTVDLCALREEKGRRACSELTVSKTARLATTMLEVQRLDLRMEELGAKEAAAERGSEVRSPVDGILADIRRIPRNEKTQIAIVIRRFR
jgi:inner membrane protein